MRYEEAMRPSPLKTALFHAWSAVRLFFPLLIAIPLYWVTVKIDIDYRLLHPADVILYGRGREFGVLYAKMHYYVIFVYAAHNRIKDILAPIL